MLERNTYAIFLSAPEVLAALKKTYPDAMTLRAAPTSATIEASAGGVKITWSRDAGRHE